MNHQWNGNNVSTGNREQRRDNLNSNENYVKADQQRNINKSQKNEYIKQPAPAVRRDNNSNFNNTYKNSDAVRSINSIRDNKSSKPDNSSKSSPGSVKADAKVKPHQDAVQSSRRIINKKSGTPVQLDKSRNDHPDKSGSAEEKK